MNDIIDKIYTQHDFDTMRLEFLKATKVVIPFNKATFFLAGTTKEHIMDRPLSIGVPHKDLRKYIDEYEDIDYTRWIFMSNKSMVFRESDLFNDAARENEAVYRDIYKPAELYFSAQVNCTNKGEFAGLICYYRSKEQGDFTEKELFILELLQPHIENRIAMEKRKNSNRDSVETCAHFDAYRFIKEYKLTVREVEILELLMEGFTLEKICEMLSVSASTLKKHSVNIYKKLGINHRWELIRLKD